jgi:hypothetical protein
LSVPSNAPLLNIPNQVLANLGNRILVIYPSTTRSKYPWDGEWKGTKLLEYPELKKRMIVVPSKILDSQVQYPKSTVISGNISSSMVIGVMI